MTNLDTLTTIFIILSTISCGLYILSISLVTYGWIKIKEQKDINHPKILISIIVPFRNEEGNIGQCIQSLISQDYSSEFFEIIFIDDSSIDNSRKLIEPQLLQHSNITLINLKDHGLEGKKKAIETGINKAKGELIITTDADCHMGKNWLRSIVNLYISSNAKMIVAPVVFENEKNFFEKMQSLEFIALMASTGGTIYFNRPTMCNGANLAYNRQTFYEINGFEDIDSNASGDDVLLMYKFDKHYPGSIKFLKNIDSVVFTSAQRTLKAFIHQRIRWASKGVKQMNFASKSLAIVIFVFNLFIGLNILILLGYFAFQKAFPLVLVENCLIIFGFKCIIDFLLLFLASRFFSKRGLLIYFLLQQLIYPFYVIGIGLMGRRKKYIWKDRIING